MLVSKAEQLNALRLLVAERTQELEKSREQLCTAARRLSLGLSTVMAIVKSHEGIINVYSELGKGSTFKVYLPALESSFKASTEPSGLACFPRGNGETILVIDDEAPTRTITAQTLNAHGYRVLTASDGAEAVAIYAKQEHEIAVVLTDMNMPVMDGRTTIHALMKINPAVKIIAASGLNANGGVTKMNEATVKHFLTKPYSAETLLKTMRAILDKP
jgi:CheY-like chemotaxis protein